MLQIKPEMDVFACAYCGTNMRVAREGGAVMLKALVRSVASVRQGVDRTAAELAIPRLRREIREAEKSRDARVAEAKTAAEQLSTPAVLIAYAFFAIAIATWWFFSTGWALIPLFIGLSFGSVKASPDNSAAVAKECNFKIAELQRQLAIHRSTVDLGSSRQQVR